MNTLCFGGSFNPIHYGHLRCATAVARTLGFSRILLIPSAQPPHKPNSPDLASAEHRLAMCRLAVADHPIFYVSDIETRRSGPSYTLYTVRELQASGINPIYWLIGADMLQILPAWHRPEELLREVHFIIMARPGRGFDWQSLPAEYQHLKSHVVEAPLIDISASEIRRRVREEESVKGLTPDSVISYIREYGLYR